MNATTKEEQNALTLPERAAVALGESANAAKLRELAAQSSGIVTVTNQDGRDEAHRAGMVLLKTRTGIRATGKAARDDATKFSKAVIAMEDELIGIIEPEETRVLALRDAWDEKIASEKAAKIAAERARTEAIEARIQAIRNAPLSVVGKCSAEILVARDAVRDTIISEELFGEQSYQDKAMDARSDAFNALETAFEAAEQAEVTARAAEEARLAEIARIEAERAELAQLRAAAAETARLAKIETDRISAEQAKEAKRLADLKSAQEAEQRRIAEQAAANLKAEREAQEDAMRLQREAQAKEQAKAADEIRIAREKLEAAQAAHNAAVLAQQEATKLEVDHAEALADNATFDDAMARLAAIEVPTFTEPSDLARCNGMVADLRADAQMIASVEAYEAAGLASETPVIDYEAIAWAYQKLLAFGVGNGSMDNAMMLDRLNLMLLTAGEHA